MDFLRAGITRIRAAVDTQAIRSHLGSFAGQQLGAGAVLGDIDGDGARDYLVTSTTQFWGYSGRTGALVFTFPKLTQSYGEYLTERFGSPDEAAMRRVVREHLQRRLSAPRRIGCEYHVASMSAERGFAVAEWVSPRALAALLPGV